MYDSISFQFGIGFGLVAGIIVGTIITNIIWIHSSKSRGTKQ